MALTKPAAGKPASKFEEEDNTKTSTAVADKPATVAPKTTDTAAATAGVKASTEVARISANSLATGQKLETLFAGHKNAIPKVDFGVLPRLVAASGGVQNKSDNVMLGDKISIQLVSWNDQFVVSPGSDDKEDTALVRYSSDGVTIDETGEDVKAYLKKLRETDGFKDANVKEYAEVIGILQGVFKGSDAKASDLIDSMVQISLSPSSRKLFEGFRLQESVKMRLNPALTPSDVVFFTAEVKTQGANTFTVLKPSSK